MLYRIQANDLIMCGCFCIGFIYFMLKGKGNSLSGYTKLFSLNEYEKNYKIILNYFQELETKNLLLRIDS